MITNQIKYKYYLLKNKLLFSLRKKSTFRNFINSIDDPRKRKFLCKSCNSIISGMVYHGGFSDISAFYCSGCHAALYLRGGKEEPPFPDTTKILPDGDYGRTKIPLWEKFEEQLPKCKCGGSFNYLNPPRCPCCSGMIMGDIYEGKPVLKDRDYYAIDFGLVYNFNELTAQQ